MKQSKSEVILAILSFLVVLFLAVSCYHDISDSSKEESKTNYSNSSRSNTNECYWDRLERRGDYLRSKNDETIAKAKEKRNK